MIYIILTIGFLLRLWNLDQSFWLDEAINVLAVRDNSLVKLLTQYALGDFHPPFYHILLWFWTRGLGFTETSTRMLSVIFAVATVFLCFFLLKRIFTYPISLLSALFLATSPLHIYYSQEARMYAETAFFALLSIYFFIKIITDGSKKQTKTWIGYSISTLILIYSEYLPIFLILAQNVIVFLYIRKLGKNFLKKWLFSQLVLLTLFLPWVPFLWQQFQNATMVGKVFPVWNLVVGQFSIKSVVLLYVKFIIGRISLSDKFIYGVVVSPIILFILWLNMRFWAKKRYEKTSMVLLLLFLLPILLSIITSVFISIFSYFRFLYLLPVFYILLAVSIETFSRRSVQIAVSTVLLTINVGSLVIFNTHARFWREDWKSAVFFIESRKEKDSIAVMVNPAQNAGYRYYSRGVVPLVYGNEWKSTTNKTIWLFRYVQPIFDINDTVRQKIEEAGFKKSGEYDFTGVVIWKYKI